MACVRVEMSVQRASRRPSKPAIHLSRCPECGAPMLLMSATEALNHPITLRKTYQCMVCETVETVVAPKFE